MTWIRPAPADTEDVDANKIDKILVFLDVNPCQPEPKQEKDLLWLGRPGRYLYNFLKKTEGVTVRKMEVPDHPFDCLI